jgi:hypothetical protein
MLSPVFIFRNSTASFPARTAIHLRSLRAFSKPWCLPHNSVLLTFLLTCWPNPLAAPYSTGQRLFADVLPCLACVPTPNGRMDFNAVYHLVALHSSPVWPAQFPCIWPLCGPYMSITVFRILSRILHVSIVSFVPSSVLGCLAFFGFVRVSEFTCPGTFDRLRLLAKSSKTDPFRRGVRPPLVCSQTALRSPLVHGITVCFHSTLMPYSYRRNIIGSFRSLAAPYSTGQRLFA